MALTVRVPASSANLGPGFDCFAAALDLWLELSVEPADAFAFDTELDVPADRSNLAVRAFERLRPADGLRFAMRSAIPLSGGLGSSAAATVAGLLAARAIEWRDVDLLAAAGELEGHPDNAAAALLGGVVVCIDGGATRIDPPAELAVIVVVPDEAVATRLARAALPARVPLADAVANTAHGALLMLGLARGDLELVSRGLADRLHEPYRAHLYPRSAALAADARSLGALGATISGAGPAVLLWTARGERDRVADAARERAAGWARVLPTAFAPGGGAVV